MAVLTRRDFIKRSLSVGVVSGSLLYGLKKPADALASDGIKEQVGTFIDLSRCDGCQGQEAPSCVLACREENKSRYPAPVPSDDIHYYWPNKKKEDWQDKKDLTTRLTPYNWIFVQTVEVEHRGKLLKIAIPRRCMHCENPPCANLCPFGAQAKSPEGITLINKDLCLGGAKCRDVCPWGIPARQAGVGLYMKIAPKYLGAGVMYKCDLCYDRIKGGGKPACIEACPREAIAFGGKDQILQEARSRAEEIEGYVYGDIENGGTSTFYVSPVPFEQIHRKLKEQQQTQPNPTQPGFPLMPVKVGNYLDTANGLIAGMLVAPVAGAALAVYTAYKGMKGEE